MRIRRAAFTLPALAVSGCAGEQSALDPHSPQAYAILHLFLIFLAVAAVVWIGVALALGWGLARRNAPRAAPLALDPRAERRHGSVLLSLALATGVVVLALSVLSYLAQRTVFAQPQPAVTIKVIGHQWWWEVEYESGDVPQRFITANEIHVPVGEPVRVEVSTDDVIHSFWPPSLNGKIDLINNQANSIGFIAEREGVYRGQCAEFCGEQHAHMGFEIVAEPRLTFDRWRAAQLAPASPGDGKGALVFRDRGCAYCHTIRGTLAGGRVGPDLTHVGSRRTLAAASLPLNIGNLAGWIADPQHIKPGNKMPQMPLNGDDLVTLASYLDGLK